MPAEWAPHERTLMAWPCRTELWGERLVARSQRSLSDDREPKDPYSRGA